jgi:uncharacterized protein (TIRG00374 family)
MRTLKIVLGLVVGGAFAYLLARHVDLAAVGGLLATADPFWLLAALACLTLGFGLRAVRFWLMLRRALNADVPLRPCVGPFIASFGVNNVLPLRAGDGLRLAWLGHRLDCPLWAVAGAMLVERVLDLLSLLLIGAAVLAAVDATRLPTAVVDALQLALAVAFTAALFVLVLARPTVGALNRLLGTRLGRQRHARVVLEGVRELLAAVLRTGAAKRLLYFLPLSRLAWCAEGLVFVCAALSLAYDGAVGGPPLGFALGTIATLLPGPPGHLGTFDYFAAQGLMLAGAAADPAAGVALLAHLVIWAPVSIAGAVWLIADPTMRGAAAARRRSPALGT